MSLGTSNRDGGKTSESGHLRAVSKLVTGDVITGLNAVQRAAGLNMSVDVQIGDAFLRRSDSTYSHPVFNDAVYNQVISTADGSNPRRDIVVIYVDYAETPSTGVSNNTNGVVKIKVVDGTPAGSPADPNDAAIQSSVGSGNPWTKICRVRVPAGQSSISNSLIDDLRTMITSNAATVNTAALVSGSVTGETLSTSAICLGYAETTTNFNTTSGTAVQVPGLSLTVTVPAGGRRLEIQAGFGNIYNGTTNAGYRISLWDGTVGSGTVLNQATQEANAPAVANCISVSAFPVPAAGSKTYNVGVQTVNGGTINTQASVSNLGYLIVKAI